MNKIISMNCDKGQKLSQMHKLSLQEECNEEASENHQQPMDEYFNDGSHTETTVRHSVDLLVYQFLVPVYRCKMRGNTHCRETPNPFLETLTQLQSQLKSICMTTAITNALNFVISNLVIGCI